MSMGDRAALWLALALALNASPALAAEPAPEPRSTRVATRRLAPAPVELTLPAKVGVMEAAQSIEVAFEVAGRVVRVRGEGSRVAAGDEIAGLDDALEQAQLRQAELRLEEANLELGRVRNLQRSSAASDKALSSATTAAGLARAERDVARERLARRTLTARFGGIIGDVRIDPGEVATPGAPIATLLNFDLMKIEFGVPGYQVGRVPVGGDVRIAVPALEGETFDGTVLAVAPSAADGEHLFEVDVLIPNVEGRLRPGMAARGAVVIDEMRSAVRVPLDCVVPRGDERHVFFADGGIAVAVPVADAEVQGDEVILPDPAPLRDLVVRGQHDLTDGVPIEVDNSVLSELPPSGTSARAP
jgi:membrane fusion protein (multidrug efflux system)